MVPDHDLSLEIRLLLLYWCNNAGQSFPTLSFMQNSSNYYSQLLIVVLPQNSAEFGLTIAAIPIVLVLLILCGIAVKREIKWYLNGRLRGLVN